MTSIKKVDFLLDLSRAVNRGPKSTVRTRRELFRRATLFEEADEEDEDVEWREVVEAGVIHLRLVSAREERERLAELQTLSEADFVIFLRSIWADCSIRLISKFLGLLPS